MYGGLVMTRRRIVYWLWNGDRPIDAVRLSEGLSDKEVVLKAVQNHRQNPRTHERGYETKLLEATVKTLKEVSP
jgi:hypothetical protein